MDDIVSQIQERYAKAVAKVDKAEKALESARSEVTDLQAAIRVIESLSPSLSSGPRSNVSDSMVERQQNIVSILGVGPDKGLEPKELHAEYAVVFDGNLTLDTFRTTIWRMKDKAYDSGGSRWTVQNENGRYWKRPAATADDENPFAQYATTIERTAPNLSAWDDDVDSEEPF